VAYLPIESYGLVGNMRTAALVGTNGSIDWLCFPHFDSPSIFAAILDDKHGGRFVISPASRSIAQNRSTSIGRKAPPRGGGNDWEQWGSRCWY